LIKKFQNKLLQTNEENVIRRQILFIKQFKKTISERIFTFAINKLQEACKMILNRKKKHKNKLLNEFGNLKDDLFYFELIEKYFRKKGNSDYFQILSDKTCNDLDFQELFTIIDRTNSKIGQQFLYNKLRSIPLDSKKFKHEKLIEEFGNNSNLRISIQNQLSKLNDDETYYISTLFQEEHLKPPKWFIVIKLLSFTSVMALILSFFNSIMIFVVIGVVIINIIIHYWNKRNLYQYLDSIPRLLSLINITKKLFSIKALKEINPNLLISIKIIDRIKKRMSFIKLEAKLQGDFEVIFWGIIELFKILFLLEPLFLFGVLKQLDSKRKEVEDLYIFVGEIDSLISISSLRKGLSKFCIPNIINEQKTLLAKDVYHPLIDDCVKNSININKKSILLTGSNMSGKTSFIRTIGINVITGLTLNTCFADRFTMPRMSIYSAIRISDDLMNDKSYYFEEVFR